MLLDVERAAGLRSRVEQASRGLVVGSPGGTSGGGGTAAHSKEARAQAAVVGILVGECTAGCTVSGRAARW